MKKLFPIKISILFPRFLPVNGYECFLRTKCSVVLVKIDVWFSSRPEHLVYDSGFHSLRFFISYSQLIPTNTRETLCPKFDISSQIWFQDLTS